MREITQSHKCDKKREEIILPQKVCKKFNEIGGNLLSRGFYQLEKRHVAIYKRVKSGLPRRESERKSHPLARYNDILQAVETRLSMMNMTYLRYIENGQICFIPGKVLDETKRILDLVQGDGTPPRAHVLLQELRDLSSMAIEHFDEHILPKCRDEIQKKTGIQIFRNSEFHYLQFAAQLQRELLERTTSARMVLHEPLGQPFSFEKMLKLKRISKDHKYRITYLTQNTQRLNLKLRRQNNKLRLQSAKLREHEHKHQEQERKLQEQNTKILEQDAALSDIKKHMEEWDQKYKDLTAELVRAREEILLKTSSSQSSPNLNSSTQPRTFLPQFKSNIKPRRTYILPKSYQTYDPDRKRKSSLSPETPIKRSRSPNIPIKAKPRKSIQNLKFNIPDLEGFQATDPISTNVETCPETVVKEKTKFVSSFFDKLLHTNNTRKRKITEDIDLK
ncbi:unnamed protein product [Ceutorhynchus assimilis]|uniref:Uncharacterized protein n=1 Tax=Ceutorhynchus assimilis TaxID=467358 RepID=A0A9N9MGH7_9CUCU|nr:unnamed protein product [Ceutorhynchus assimilis]